MKIIEIVEEKSEEVKLTKDEIFKIISQFGAYYFIKTYKVPEYFILEYNEYFDKDIIIECCTLSEDFIEKSIDIGYLTLDDVKDLNLSTCANFSDKFIFRYKEHINWDRMILYLSTQSDSFDDYIKIV